MSEVRVGQVYRDNDPRISRTVSVERIDRDHAFVRASFSGKVTKVLLTRLHRDGKPRRTGFSVIQRQSRRAVSSTERSRPISRATEPAETSLALRSRHAARTSPESLRSDTEARAVSLRSFVSLTRSQRPPRLPGDTSSAYLDIASPSVHAPALDLAANRCNSISRPCAQRSASALESNVRASLTPCLATSARHLPSLLRNDAISRGVNRGVIGWGILGYLGCGCIRRDRAETQRRC